METLKQRCLDYIIFLEKALEVNLELSVELLSQVLVHPSYAHEKSLLSTYERLEFLGDSIVNAIITSTLFEKFQIESEGTLSRIKAVLVSTESLASLALAIDLDKFLYVTGTLNQDSNELKNIKLNKTQGRAFEALIGAFYLSAGFDKTTSYFNKIVACWEGQQKQSWFDKDRLMSIDVKSILQEKLHTLGLMNPQYVMVEHEKKNPQDEFIMALIVNDNEIARAKSTSKKEAEKLVAKKVLDSWSTIYDSLKKVE